MPHETVKIVPYTSERLRISVLLRRLICSTVWTERLAKPSKEVTEVTLACEKSPLPGPSAETTQLPGSLLQELLPDQLEPTGLSALLPCPPRGSTARASGCILIHQSKGACPQSALPQGFSRVEVPPPGGTHWKSLGGRSGVTKNGSCCYLVGRSQRRANSRPRVG